MHTTLTAWPAFTASHCVCVLFQDMECAASAQHVILDEFVEEGNIVAIFGYMRRDVDDLRSMLAGAVSAHACERKCMQVQTNIQILSCTAWPTTHNCGAAASGSQDPFSRTHNLPDVLSRSGGSASISNIE